MKTERSLGFTRTLLLSLGLVAAGLASAADQVVFCARASSENTRIWDPPFWWIPAGGDPYGTSTAKSTATGAPSSRVGSYWRNAYALFPGEGFGVACTACSVAPGLVYAVEVTQPNVSISTNILFGVCSTNCTIGGLSGGGGYATNTTAFQDVYSVNKWGFVCWLTNTAGMPNPQIEFHYVSGGVGDNLRHYADCVRFTLLTPSSGPTPVRISSFAGSALAYSGGSGTRFVLLKCGSLCDWQRVATNFVTPGSFSIPAVGTEAAAFYAIASE
jgi:hypothetical protein